MNAWCLAIALGSVLCAIASDVTDCTYEGYSSWAVVGDAGQITLYIHGNVITATAVDYGLGSLDFPEGHNNTACRYNSTDYHNGWAVASSGTNGCVQTITRDFLVDDYIANCAAEVVETDSGSEIITSFEEWTIPLFTGYSLDGSAQSVQVGCESENEILLPSSVPASVSFTVGAPTEYGATANGTVGIFGTTDYLNLFVQVKEQYYITSINPMALETPANTPAVVLQLDKDSWPWINGLVTIYPPEADCKVDGTFIFQLNVSCLDEDPACDGKLLENNPFFTVTANIDIPDCYQQTQDVDAFLTIRTYDKDDKFETFFHSSTVIIDEVITTVRGTPSFNCNCSTYIDVYDWYGNPLGHYNVEENKELFEITTLVHTPLQNKFSTYLHPSVFPEEDRQVVQITGTCELNWGVGKKTTVSSTRGHTLRNPQPLNAEGNAAIAVWIQEDDTDPQGEDSMATIIGVVGGVAACGVVGLVGCTTYRKFLKAP